jgi:S1-C subfamily serine protease
VAELLQKVSNEMAELVRLAGPSVVRVEGRRRTPGSGIVWSADGLVLTANHVVKRGSRWGRKWSAATRPPTWPCSRPKPAG